MGKQKIGSIRQKTFVQGDMNLLVKGEILVSEEEGHIILRERTDEGTKTSVIIPLEEFLINKK